MLKVIFNPFEERLKLYQISRNKTGPIEFLENESKRRLEGKSQGSEKIISDFSVHFEDHKLDIVSGYCSIFLSNELGGQEDDPTGVNLKDETLCFDSAYNPHYYVSLLNRIDIFGAKRQKCLRLLLILNMLESTYKTRVAIENIKSYITDIDKDILEIVIQLKKSEERHNDRKVRFNERGWVKTYLCAQGD